MRPNSLSHRAGWASVMPSSGRSRLSMKLSASRSMDPEPRGRNSEYWPLPKTGDGGLTYAERVARENKDRANPYAESFPSTLFRNPACWVTCSAVDIDEWQSIEYRIEDSRRTWRSRMDRQNSLWVWGRRKPYSSALPRGRGKPRHQGCQNR